MHAVVNMLMQNGFWLLAAPFVATVALVIMLQPLAPAAGLMAYPSGRRGHAAPTPLIGGQALVLSALGAGALFVRPTAEVVALGAASLLLLAVGTLDDRYDINWRVRLLGQAAAALILFQLGGVRIESIGAALGFPEHTLGALSLPLTVLATVGLANAVNMADGIDGLAGSLCLAALGMLLAAAIYAGNAELAPVVALMIGAVLGFMSFNLRTPWRPRASVFLGGGAEILGLWVAWAAFRLTQTPNHPVMPVLAPFLIAPPVLDCLALIVMRLREGRSPFSSDRNHLHHRLLKAGFSTTAIVASLTGISLLIGLAAALARRAHLDEPVFPAVYLAGSLAYVIALRRPLTTRRPVARGAPTAAAPSPARQIPAE